MPIRLVKKVELLHVIVYHNWLYVEDFTKHFMFSIPFLWCSHYSNTVQGSKLKKKSSRNFATRHENLVASSQILVSNGENSVANATVLVAISSPVVCTVTDHVTVFLQVPIQRLQN